MRLKFLWPGQTKNPELRSLQESYIARIRTLADCRVIATRVARGLGERQAQRILEIEAQGLENQLKDDYIICLSDEGQTMTSAKFARFLAARGVESRRVAFVVGGFLGLAERILRRADLRLALSTMTMSHELCRVVLLEQVYRSLTIIQGRRYAK